MGTHAVHKEDIKALLRKRYGSIGAFQKARGLVGQQVRDLMRGKSNAAREAIADELGIDPQHLVIITTIPIAGIDSSVNAPVHRLSVAAK